MKDNLDFYELYERLLKYRVALKSIVGDRKDTDLILLNEEQKATIREGTELIKEVEKKIRELECVGFGKGGIIT